ncbi:MAG TPA: hypothetical protein VMU89_14990 [Thermomicrobiaceae bacterium]|nr:hypothetical protein [Thermomicrobiaceae bacterium]
MRCCLLLAVLLVAAVAYLAEPLWYGPIVHALPAAGLFLPQPSGYRP